jgi:tetratricopeptide (TPR) repeat protein
MHATLTTATVGETRVNMSAANPPDNLEELITRGRNLCGCGYPTRALPFFLRAVRMYPDALDARQELRRTRREIRGLQSIVSRCERHVAVHPEDVEAWSELAHALVGLDREEDALQAYEQALDQAQDEDVAFEILFSEGNLLNNLSMYEEALEVFDEVISLVPDFAVGYSLKAMVLSNMGRFDETLQAADRAIELDPGDIGAWAMKVKALTLLGRAEEAREAHSYEDAARRASGVPEWMPRDGGNDT